MKNFKQYIKEQLKPNTSIYNACLDKIRDIVTKEPYNYKWVFRDIPFNEQFICAKHQSGAIISAIVKTTSEYSTNTMMEITTECPYIQSTNVYLLRLRRGESVEPFTIQSYTLHEFDRDDSTTAAGFYVSKFLTARLAEISHMYEAFNYYMNIPGNAIERYIKTVDKFTGWEGFFDKENREAIVNLALKKKREEEGDESLTTDDWIDMGMSNI